MDITNTINAIARLPREAQEEIIELAIERLDQLDGDPDLEPTMGHQPGLDECEGPDSDLEPDVDDELSGDEREPSLGAAEIPPTYTARIGGEWGTYHGDQTRWAAGARDEREDDPAEGPIDDDERENDPAEMGIGDSGGLHTDDEPSLGALEYPVGIEQKRSADGCRLISEKVRPMSQVGWGSSGANDAEQDVVDEPHDGDEREGDESEGAAFPDSEVPA